MLNAAHAECSGAADGDIGMAVGKDVKTTNVGFLHRRQDFGIRELQRVDRVGRTGDPAGAHQFHLPRTPAKLLPHGLANGIAPSAMDVKRASGAGQHGHSAKDCSNMERKSP